MDKDPRWLVDRDFRWKGVIITTDFYIENSDVNPHSSYSSIKVSNSVSTKTEQNFL